MVIYFLLFLVELVLQSNGGNHVIVEILSLSFGVLAVILEVLIINPLLGWVALGMGCVAFVSVIYHFRNDIVNTLRNDFVNMNAWWNGNANGQEVNGRQVELHERDADRNDNAVDQQVNGMQDELGNGNNGMQDELRNDNAIEQQVNGMQDELRNGNANEQQQVNGMPGENQ